MTKMFLLVCCILFSSSLYAQQNDVSNVAINEISETDNYVLKQKKEELHHSIVQSVAPLTFDLGKYYFNQQKNNFVVSGLSLYFILDLFGNGANNQTYQKISELMGTSDLNKTNQLLSEYLKNQENLTLHNSLWGNAFKQSYQDEITKLFDIGIFPLPEHTSVINEWIYQKSNHMLKNVLAEEKTLETDVFLVNTVYFEDEWEIPFKVLPNLETFTDLSGKEHQIKMMHKQNKRLYYENSKYQATVLKYKNNANLFVFLPRIPIDQFLEKLSPDMLKISSFTQSNVDFKMPMFEMTSNINLNNVLINMGYTDLLDDTADFSRLMYVIDEPYETKIVQQAKFILDNKKTVAAASTVGRRSLIRARNRTPQRVYEFHANKPFVFVLDTGMFLGVYAYPNVNK